MSDSTGKPDPPAKVPASDSTVSIPTDSTAIYRQVYVEETREELDTLVEALLTLENDTGNVAALNEAFRLVHSIKGSSAMMGYANVGDLAHAWEDLLDKFRSGGIELVKDHVDLMLRCVDAIREFVEALANSDQLADADPAATKSLTESLRETLSAPEAPGDDTFVLSDPRQPKPAAANALATNVFNNFQLTVTFDPNLQLPDLKAQLIASRLADLGEIVHVEPDFDETELFESKRQFRLTLLTQQSVDEVRNTADLDGVASIDIKPHSSIAPVTVNMSAVQPVDEVPVEDDLPAEEDTIDESSPQPAEDSPAKQPAATTAQASETIRVEIDRLDRLMNLTGELVVNQERFRELRQKMAAQFRRKGVPTRVGEAATRLDALRELGPGAAEFDSADAAPPNWRESIRDDASELRQYAELWEGATECFGYLDSAVDQLTRVSDDLQRAVMETRMVPLSPLFNRFKRVVRDLASGAGKNVRLDIRGEKTELDKRMIDELADPLIHIVRNAIDHGLETPEERSAAGKPDTATITLSALHRGNNVYISVADDGRGIDLERIRNRVIERSLLSASAAHDLSDQQIVDYIWHPGFSTAETVTEISGRGVGMDIVRNRINALCGTIEVDFEPGQGTSFTVRLPLTLAIIPSLLLQIDGGTFSVPLEEVREIVRVSPDRVVSIHNRRAIELRGEFVPIIRLTDVFRWHADRARNGNGTPRQNGSREVVVLRVTGNSFALEVDAPLGVSELVVKSLADNFQDVEGLSGASVLASGEVSLMLDSAALAEMARPVRSASTGDSA